MKKLILFMVLIVSTTLLVSCNKDEIKNEKLVISDVELISKEDSYLVGSEYSFEIKYSVNLTEYELIKATVNNKRFDVQEKEGIYLIKMSLTPSDNKLKLSDLTFKNKNKERTLRVDDVEIEVEIRSDSDNLIKDFRVETLTFEGTIVNFNESLKLEKNLFELEEVEIILEVLVSVNYGLDLLGINLINGDGVFYEDTLFKLERLDSQGVEGNYSEKYKTLIPTEFFKEDYNALSFKCFSSEDGSVSFDFKTGQAFAFDFMLKEPEISKDYEFSIKKPTKKEYHIENENLIFIQSKNNLDSTGEMIPLNLRMSFGNMPERLVSSVLYTLEINGERKDFKISKDLIKFSVDGLGRNIIETELKLNYDDGEDVIIKRVGIEALLDGKLESLYDEYSNLSIRLEKWSLLIKDNQDFEKLYKNNNYKTVLLLNDINIRQKAGNTAEVFIEEANYIFEGNGKTINDHSTVSLIIKNKGTFRNFYYKSEFYPSNTREDKSKVAFMLENAATGIIENVVSDIFVRREANRTVDVIHGFVKDNKGLIKQVEIKNTYKLEGPINKLTILAESNSGKIDDVVFNHFPSMHNQNSADSIVTYYQDRIFFDLYVVENTTNNDKTSYKNIIFNLRLNIREANKIENLYSLTSSLGSDSKVNFENIYFSKAMEERWYQGAGSSKKEFLNESGLSKENYLIVRTRMQKDKDLKLETVNEFSKKDNESVGEFFEKNNVSLSRNFWTFDLEFNGLGFYKIKIPVYIGGKK